VEVLVLVSVLGVLHRGGGHLLVYITILPFSGARMTNRKNEIKGIR
jgi:hypothetical protein